MNTLLYRGHALTWEEHTSGDHTYIFIHGYSASQRAWVRDVDLFAPLGRCVTLDLPGHYPAQAPPNYQVLTQDELLDMETEAVRQIANGRPVTLVGHSTGGLVALGVAARLPGQVQRVVSIDGVVWGPLTGLLDVAHRLLRNGLYPAFWALWRFTQIAPWAMMVGLSFYAHDLPAHWRNGVAWEVCRHSHAGYKRQAIWNLSRLINTLEVCDLRPLVPDIAAPVLVQTGAHDPVVPPEQAHWLAEHLPDATLQVFANAGHLPHVEQRAAWERMTLGWLAAPPV